MADHNESVAAGEPDPKTQNYYEFQYPYVMPKEDILELLGEEMNRSLTPLENTFVRWFIQVGNSNVALQNLIHPAHPFDVKNYSAAKIMSRPSVKDVIKQVKKKCPYLRLYNADYMVELLHDEIQHLRFKTRNGRYYGQNANLNAYGGKKSLHEEETADMDLLLRCLEMVGKLTSQVKVGDESAAGSQSSNTNLSVDRVIAEAQRLINGAKATVDGRVG